ncbi:MAG: glycerate kinase [Deltaproteobacteria bacterium]|nr:glycerate kinase [Deltaproteobacteria bacterium]
MNLRQAILDIYREGLVAVLPENMIRDAVTVTDEGLIIGKEGFPIAGGSRVHVFGSGKASIGAAKALEDVMGDRITGGLIVSSYDDSSLERIEVCVGAHPMPDEKSLHAADLLINKLTSLTENDFFIYLLSGGSSALIERPFPPLTIKDLQDVSAQLMNAGATIDELNAVRKHLSMIKGGRLAQMTKAGGVVLVISDVIGDDLETIGSAPFYRDRSTFSDVQNILSRYNLSGRLSLSVMALVEKGLAGEIEETPKEHPFKIDHIIIGSNKKALQRAKEKASSMDITAHVITSRLRGEAGEAAKVIVALGEEVAANLKPYSMPVCIILGGETTVTVRGNGKGGRNQEMCLSALREIGPRPGMVFLSAGTDGIDGNSDAAGAVVDCDSFKRVEELGLDIDDFLKRNDSNTLFEKTGDLIMTGPTGANVMDITIMLIGGKK